jgi:putative ABC transport system permease protein
MWRFALRDMSARLGSHLAVAVVLLAGTVLLTALATLLDTGLAAHRPDLTALTVLPEIVSGWTVLIVAFGVVSTVAMTVQHREREIALLRSIAATPAQVRLGVLAEGVVVAIPVVALGIPLGIPLGRLVLGRMVALHVVPPGIPAHAGWPTVTLGMLTALGAAVAGAFVTGRRAARIAPVLAIASAADAPARLMPPSRAVTGVLFLVSAIGLAVTTAFLPNGRYLGATAGPACVLAGIGFAVLSPLAVHAAGRLAAGLPSATGRLAGRSQLGRATATATVAGPLVLLVSVTTGTLYLQSTEDAAHRLTGTIGTQIASANYLVVALVIAFALIAVTNTLLAHTRRRGAEFGLLRLSGATRRQVRTMVAVESGLVSVIAILLGSVASVATIVPFCLVRTGSPLPDGPVWTYLAVLAGTVLITQLATLPVVGTGPARSR